MQISEVRDKYLSFFKERGHKAIPSSSLVPENDPTTLLTGSGMQPLLPYLLGKDHPEGNRLVNSQKCFRAEDIDEVGDNRHTTFFEMLGNWSLGDYFKEEQIPWIASFLFDELKIDPNKIYITCFAGDSNFNLEKDEQSAKIWQKIYQEKGLDSEIVEIGSQAGGSQKGMQNGRIFYYGSDKNWWSRSGKPETMPAGEPGGPDTEMFYDFGLDHDTSYGPNCHPNCDCGRFVEIGNSVFMQYQKDASGKFTPLPKQNVDFGGGLERIAMAVYGIDDVFKIDVFSQIFTQLGRNYESASEEDKKAMRIVADHIRGAVFIASDGVFPSNKEQGYILRRLLRRAIFKADSVISSSNSNRHSEKSDPSVILREAKYLGSSNKGFLASIAKTVIESYQDAYPSLSEKEQEILSSFSEEEAKFRRTLENGLKEFKKISEQSENISGQDAFTLFATYGFPLELTVELASQESQDVDIEGFNEEFKKHQDKSKNEDGKFKGGLADTSEKTTMLHTSTHLMLAGLRKYLGEEVHQAGSNITQERTRFDFNYPEKVSREILDKVEAYVNEAISAKADVVIETMPKEKAQAEGVEGSFWEKYPDTVDVYVIKASDGTYYSRELCGGPHVKNTGDIKGTFKITKEESSSAGIRRIKAVLE